MKYKIKTVGDPREWSNDYGRFYGYPCDLEDEQGHVHLGVEWSRKVDSKAPEVGDEVVGDIKGGQHGDRLKVDWDAMGGKKGGGGSSNGNGRGPWKPDSELDPEKVARITRSHAQQMAVRVLTANQGFNTNEDVAKRKEALVAWTDFFEGDVEEAALAAKAKGTASTSETKPAESTEPTPAESGEKSDDIPF